MQWKHVANDPASVTRLSYPPQSQLLCIYTPSLGLLVYKLISNWLWPHCVVNVTYFSYFDIMNCSFFYKILERPDLLNYLFYMIMKISLMIDRPGYQILCVQNGRIASWKEAIGRKFLQAFFTNMDMVASAVIPYALLFAICNKLWIISMVTNTMYFIS